MFRFRPSLPSAGIVVAALAALWTGTAQASEGETYFENEIRPVLATRCAACHGPEKAEGGVRLDARGPLAELVADGGFVRVIRGQSTAPAACVLEPRLVAAFEQWIALGLPWPERATVTSAEDRAAAARLHWAFQPVREPAVPAGADHPIDAFIRDRLAREGLTPSPEADRRTLLRRLSYTLTGLPPGEVIGDQRSVGGGPEAPNTDHRLPITDNDWSAAVDHHLASPHYGEHWARHWLDLARYSDTKGYVYAREEKSSPHAWVYRDWVVGALNEDLPYDRFLVLQLAADRIDDKKPGDEAAMGFLTIGRRFLGVKDDIIDDRIDVVSRGMLGLTVTCARCHDHKYDPIPAADYYSLHGVFGSSIERRVALPGGDEAFWKAHRERVASYDEAMAKARTEAADRVRERLADYLGAQTELDKFPADNFGQITRKTDLLASFVHAWRDYLRDTGERGDSVFAHWHAYRETAPERYAEVKVVEAHPLVARAFSTPPASFDEVVARYTKVLHEDDETLRAVIRGPGSPCEVPEGSVADVESFFDSDSLKELWKLENEIARALAGAPASARSALILEDRAIPVEPRILNRGNPLNRGDRVPRQTLGVLSAGKREPFTIGSGRLELAEAIADPANPLTARVLVNRVWARHFGTGLVDTPSDFGTRANPPSHPELLDWLAVWFVKEGWSLKKLHRLILTSETWRQSSFGPSDPVARAKAVAADPENRLLWRMNSHRLGYEEIRDAMTTAAGQLDLTLGGKPVEALKAPFATRRALYGRIDRQFVPGELRVFDFANPDLHIPKRNETTVPQQALFFLNHPFVLERSRSLAALTEKESDAASRVRTLFRRALQRDATELEITEALALVAAAERAVAVPPPLPTAPDWSYGHGSFDESAQRVAGFTALPHFTGTAWQGGEQWPDAKLGWVQLTASGGHPGNGRHHAAVRRWTAPRAVTIAIRSKLVHEPKAGDGIRAFVVSSRVGLLGSAKLHANATELKVEAIAVEADETIDFLVDIGEGLNSDQFLWSIALRELADGDGENPARAWEAARDFPADSATPLSAWEQLAQAVLCSNEFLFVD